MSLENVIDEKTIKNRHLIMSNYLKNNKSCLCQNAY